MNVTMMPRPSVTAEIVSGSAVTVFVNDGIFRASEMMRAQVTATMAHTVANVAEVMSVDTMLMPTDSVVPLKSHL